jgi:preprotein translocase subunit SecE
MRKVAWSPRAEVVHNSTVYAGVIVVVTLAIASINIGLAAIVRAAGL